MNMRLMRCWNSLVQDDDEVFHLGDVALGPWDQWENILPRLHGRKILVIGNHDRIFRGMPQKQQDKFIPHYNRWFDDYYDDISGFELSDGTVVNLSHFPYDGDSHDGDRYTEFRLPDDGVPLIHGHTHLDQITSRSKKGTLQVHVGVDAWDFSPVPESKVIQVIKGHS